MAVVTRTKVWTWALALYVWATICASSTYARPYPYDPNDTNLSNLLPSQDKEFEAFYPREAYGVKNGSARPSHGHGSYYKFRNPALVDAKNSPAYGYRFDGGRRFNFDKVIIKVPQRTKHIYHHEVKKVPVYVLLPEKKTKVLDDLEEVTKVLPCREREREREPPWQDDVVVGPLPSKYRYARHYDQNTVQEHGDVDVDDATSIWQQETKRWLRPPSSTSSLPQRQRQQRQQQPRRYKSDPLLTATADRYPLVESGSDPPDYTAEAVTGSDGGQVGVNRPTSEAIIRSPYSSAPSLYRKGNRIESGGATPSTPSHHRHRNSSDRTRYARYYDYEDDSKSSLQTKPPATTLQAKSNVARDIGRYYANTNGNAWTSTSVEKEKLTETLDNDISRGGVVGTNFIRIGYPPVSVPAPSFKTGKSTATYDSSDAVVTVDQPPPVFQFQSDRNQRRPQLSPASFDGLPPSTVGDNYASSYQYKIQH